MKKRIPIFGMFTKEFNQSDNVILGLYQGVMCVITATIVVCSITILIVVN